MNDNQFECPQEPGRPCWPSVVKVRRSWGKDTIWARCWHCRGENEQDTAGNRIIKKRKRKKREINSEEQIQEGGSTKEIKRVRNKNRQESREVCNRVRRRNKERRRDSTKQSKRNKGGV